MNTVGGLIQMQLGRIPNVGDSVRWNGLRMEVNEMEGLRIARVRLTRYLVPSTPGEHAAVREARNLFRSSLSRAGEAIQASTLPLQPIPIASSFEESLRTERLGGDNVRGLATEPGNEELCALMLEKGTAENHLRTIAVCWAKEEERCPEAETDDCCRNRCEPR